MLVWGTPISGILHIYSNVANVSNVPHSFWGIFQSASAMLHHLCNAWPRPDGRRGGVDALCRDDSEVSIVMGLPQAGWFISLEIRK